MFANEPTAWFFDGKSDLLKILVMFVVIVCCLAGNDSHLEVMAALTGN